MVRLDGVTKRYGDLVVLDQLNLDVAHRERVAIIGPSGSGKSTLLRLLMTLERPDEGTIHVGGRPLFHMERKGRLVAASKKHIRSVRSDIGMVFQHFHLFPHMSALDNIIEGPVRVLELKRKDAVARGKELLDMVGLADKAGQRPARLSGGQQQRVAIARACAMRPRVMLFDEVTSALDPELVGEVLSTIRHIADQHDVTVLIVTHEMNFAKEFADRVCFFDQGEICEQGPAKQLLTNPGHPRTQRFLQAVLG